MVSLRVRLDPVERAAEHHRVRLADEVGSRPVALVIMAATEPVAGIGPSADGPVTSGLVAMNRAPPRIEPDGLGDRRE